MALTVPAGTGPAPPASLAGAPVAVDAATGKPELPPDKSDPRWQDVDPNTLGGRDENALAKFQAEQRKRDAELMAQDAREANSRVAGGEGRDDRRDRDEPYADERYADERYADPREEERRYDPREDERRYDPREDERDYGDAAYGYDPADEAPWEDEGAYDEPPPYEDEDYPPPDEDYDPRYDPGYRRP
jgi:hypothetical protein